MKTENLAIAFVDIVGFTPRTSSQTREENEALLKRFEGVVRPVVRGFGGQIVKSIGDAYLMTFRSPTDALLCAMALHDRLAESNGMAAERDRFDIRVAVNVGEVRIDAGDVFGEAVNIAARIEGHAEAGEIWFSEAVYLSMTRSEVPFQEVGPRELKGIKDPVKLYRVPRVTEVGEYRVIGAGEPATTNHPLASVTLPYGGKALARIRQAGPLDAVQEMLDPVAAKRAIDGVRERFRNSPPFRRTVIALAITMAILLVALVAWPHKKKPVKHGLDKMFDDLGIH